jgi:hypothetical protein
MSTITVHRSSRDSVRHVRAAYATRLERVMLSAAAALTAAAEAHMQRRASRTPAATFATRDDARRDAAAAAHVGLMPR